MYPELHSPGKSSRCFDRLCITTSIENYQELVIQTEWKSLFEIRCIDNDV